MAMLRVRAVSQLACLGAGLVIGLLGAEAERPQPTKPHPSLSPEQVVRAQLHALKHNDSPTPNTGIRLAFGFASPANRKMTGPVERFISLVRNPQYESLLNYKTDKFEPIESNGEQAFQKVILLDAKGKVVTYVFLLSKQKDEPYRGCWMIDSVMPVEEAPKKTANRRQLRGTVPLAHSV